MAERYKYDVCIIGAGVAGGVLAAYLGRGGLSVAVIEKNLAEQERIVGELLQPGGVLMLQEMGLAHLLDGFDAQQIEGYVLFMKGRHFKISYPQKNGAIIKGRGFRNGKFVQKIRGYIASISSVLLLEGTAEDLIEEGDRVTRVRFISKENKEEKIIEARLTIVCDGMFSGFRETLVKTEKKVSSYFLGMILKDCNLPCANCGHVVVAQPSPCLIYPISASETRILIDFPWSEAPRKSPELLDYLRSKIAPQMPEEILPSFLAAVEEGKFKVMPNHLIPANPALKNGVVLLGDSLNMRHPLTGGGMTAAFTDIKNLGDKLFAIRDIESIDSVDEAVEQFYQSRHKKNATINILADALYGVMKNNELKTACYEYLERGGVYAEEPISILSAISRNVSLLMKHFFAVAFFCVAGILKPFPTPKRIKRAYTTLKSAVHILSPLVLNEKPGFITRVTFRMVGAMFI